MKPAHLALFLLTAILFASASSEAYKSPLNIRECKISDIEFDDGDSFSCTGEQFRILGVDTPKTKHEDHGIKKDQPYGKRAANFTKRALKKAKRIILIGEMKDKYGRRLAHAILDGELLSVKLIKAGLGMETINQHGDTHMPEFAVQILEAAAASPEPKFENPSKWRKKNQTKQEKSR